MTKKSFHLSIMVDASAEEVMTGISQVNKWWAKKVKGKSEKLNDTFTVDFGETFVDFQVSELVQPRKIVWLVTDCNLHWINNNKEWNGTQVVFEISRVGNKTKIDFTHVGLVPTAECYADCEVGWTEHVAVSLKMLINEGKGIPQ